MSRFRPIWFFVALSLTCVPVLRAELPPSDTRGSVVRDLNTLRPFTPPANAGEWQQRAADIRAQILHSCGLWPVPTKSALLERVTEPFQGDGFTAEKVHLQPSPGVYLAGNLYRPKGRSGPFPAVLSPHGHWAGGRLENTDTASVPGRCIQLARMGFVVFSYDMIGYNDSAQFSPRNADRSFIRTHFYDNHVALFRNTTNQLWNLSLMGQQLWFGMRALDFLAALPDVDANRIGITGASGGGTQSFLLAAVDDRIKVTVPAVMVSHTMQGGCFCENAPGLRVDFSNIDLAAAAAPRPQLLIGATGDWTKTTLEVEGPDVAKVYQLLGAPGNMSAVRFDFPHNYNRISREAMYAWMARWLQGQPAGPVEEKPFTLPPRDRLKVFLDDDYPPDAVSETEYTAAWIQQRQRDVEKLRPTGPESHARFVQTLTPTWSRAFALDGSEKTHLEIAGAFGRTGRGDRIERRLAMTRVDNPRAAIVLAHPDGKAAIGAGGRWEKQAVHLVAAGIPVLAFDAFQTGPQRDPAVLARSPFTNFFNTYNRTVLQERVQDIATAIAYARQIFPGARIVLIGEDAAGLWALAAARLADATLADAGNLDVADDAAMSAPELFVPGIRLLGGFDGAVALAAPKPLNLHNVGQRFTTAWVEASYAAAGKPEALRVSREPINDTQRFRWIESVYPR